MGDGVDAVLKRLEKLTLGIQEPELSEDQLTTNNQSQEDEVLALESIYGENVVFLNREGDLRSFQICIHVETPDELTISTECHSIYEDVKFETKVASSVASVSCSNEFSSTFKVQYLPPVVLTCLLPKSYPSHLPPFFTIYIQWLDPMRISKLCQMLDSIWMDQPGQEVLYQWVEWLHSSCLSYLGIDHKINLGPYCKEDAGESRAVSGSFSSNVDIPSIMNYNDVKCNKVFRESLHECFICFGEYAGINFVRLPCKHFFCSKCMETYAFMNVKEGTIYQLLCPDTKCRGWIPPTLLKRLLADKEFERWESLLLQKTLESMSDAVHCPRCETICLKDEDHHGQCSKCFFSFCTLCKEQRHVGRSCMTPEEKLARLEELQRSSQADDETLRKTQEMMNAIRSECAIRIDSRQCPSCKAAIYRTEGCNKMTCSNCGQFFCYKCGEAIKGYDHFRDTKCPVYPREEEFEETEEEREERERQRQERSEARLEWEMQNYVRRMEGQRQAELNAGADRTHLCPICRQVNEKVGNNNHIRCWSCRTHYCYLCKDIIGRSTQHFGPKGCKQHTQKDD